MGGLGAAALLLDLEEDVSTPSAAVRAAAGGSGVVIMILGSPIPLF
jgi:hypothetical protein